jgi:hypothetical protein
LISTLGRREDLLDVSYTIIAKEYWIMPAPFGTINEVMNPIDRPKNWHSALFYVDFWLRGCRKVFPPSRLAWLAGSKLDLRISEWSNDSEIIKKRYDIFTCLFYVILWTF